MKTQVHVLCNNSIPVERRDDGIFYTAGQCPSGTASGIAVSDLLTACRGCPESYKSPAGQLAKAPEPAPEPAPEVPVGTPVIAAADHPSDSGLVQGVVAGAPDATGAIPVQYPGGIELERPEHMQVDEQGSPPNLTVAADPLPLPLPAPPPLPLPAPEVMDAPENMIPLPDMPLSAEQVLAAEAAAVPELVQLSTGTTIAPPSALPEASELILPGDVSMASFSKCKVNMDAVLTSIDGCPFGSSTGGLSPHKMMDASCARRVLLSQVLGLQPLQKSRALDVGSLYHACLAMRYLYGETRQWDPCHAVAAAGDVELATEVKGLLNVQFDKYALEDWQTWCVRAVEYNMMAWLPCKIGKKTLPVPLSCRIDLVLGTKRPGEPHPGAEPMSTGVFLLDWKTTSAMTMDLVEGYGMDFQFLTQCAIFKLGNYERVFGPLRGIMVGLASKKHIKSPQYDDFQRVESPMSPATVDAFIEEELRPVAAELYGKLLDSGCRADISQWPRDRRQCMGRWGKCDYFEYCDSGAESLYTIDKSRIVDVNFFVKPPPGWSAKGELASTEKKPKATATAATETEETHMLSSSLLHQIETDDAFMPLRKENFLTPGHTLQTVSRALGATLKQFYAEAANQKMTFHEHSREWKFQKTGVAWKTAAGDKGRVSWGALATRICKDSWFNLATALPG